MPVTAKLSRKFYDKLGEDIAGELVDWFNSVDATYRADLRELNELNFARFDAKLEQRIAELRAEFHTTLSVEMARLRTELFGEFGKLSGEFGKLSGEFGKLSGEFGKLPGEFGKLRAELIKWSFMFFATAALAAIGLR